MVQGKCAKRSSFGLAERFHERHVASDPLRNPHEGQAGVCGGASRINHCRGLKHRHSVGEPEERPRPKMHPTAGYKLGCFRGTGWIGGRRIDARRIQRSSPCLRIHLTLQGPQVAQQLTRRLIAGVGTLVEALERNPFSSTGISGLSRVMGSGVACRMDSSAPPVSFRRTEAAVWPSGR